MVAIIAKYPMAFAIAIVFHIIVAIAFMANLQLNPKIVAERKVVDVVQATMIDEAKIQAERDRLKAIEDKKRKLEADRLKKLEQKKAAEKKRIKEKKRLKELERKRKKELEKKKKLAKERKEADRKRKIAEDKRKKREKAAKQAEQKRLKEVKRQREREAEVKRKKEEKRKRKAEADRKRAEEKARKAKEAQRQRAEEDRLERQRQIDDENQRLQSERVRKANKVISRYKGLIQKQVENNWHKPATAKSHMSCDVYVRMMPTGDVLKVEARRCVGDDLFKRSVEDAVRAAAPLPLPPNKSLFRTHFREITFKFKPG